LQNYPELGRIPGNRIVIQALEAIHTLHIGQYCSKLISIR